MTTDPRRYTAAQRWAALAYGVLTHTVFIAAVAMMATGLFTGLRMGAGRATGVWAWIANAALLAQFPLLHSVLLSTRGRRWIGLLAPPSLRRELGTTVYALIASVQLLIAFGLWSPLHSFEWVPGHFAFCAMAVLYATSWAMLLQAMREAGLEMHLGSLGWRAVWRQKSVVYPSLPTGPLHNRIRQPIYLAFALILWTAPVWTLDRILFTLGWTFYCVVGALFKEQRYKRYFGAAFTAYQRAVPFMLPWRRRKAPATTPDAEVDVAIAGAGPVGLLLANLLSRAGVRVAVVEKRDEPRPHSMAIGITPPSLDILDAIGLADAFRNAGLRINDAAVHESGAFAGRLSFNGIEGDHPFILSLPQSKTEELLATALQKQPGVQWWNGCEAVGFEQDRDDARLIARNVSTGHVQSIRARFVVACDGSHSALRAAARIRVRRKDYAPTFAMSDYLDSTPLGDTAHLFFSPERPVESFPLPGGLRRWIIRTGWRDQTDLFEPFEQSIARLTGHHLAPGACIWRSSFRPSRREARRFFKGQLVLCGDAAHCMSPIGGQGMNTGFSDASHLAFSLHAILRGGQTAGEILRTYERCRKAAFRCAADRAALGMWAGTRTGCLASAARAATVACLLRNPKAHRRVARWFSMRSLPEPVLVPILSPPITP